MNTLYESVGNAHDRTGYASLNGHTMHREAFSPMYKPWVLRDANGEFVDHDAYRSALSERNGFALDQ